MENEFNRDNFNKVQRKSNIDDNGSSGEEDVNSFVTGEDKKGSRKSGSGG